MPPCEAEAFRMLMVGAVLACPLAIATTLLYLRWQSSRLPKVKTLDGFIPAPTRYADPRGGGMGI